MTAVETTNGHVRARAVPPLPTITLAGVPVTLHRPGGVTMRELRAQVWAEWAASDDDERREPQPPVVPAPVVDGVQVDLPPEPNRADPDYLAAHAEWERRRAAAVDERVNDYFALEVVEVAVDPAAVARYRAMRRRFGLPVRWDGPDYVARFTPEERERLIYVAGVLMDTCTTDEARRFTAWVYRGQLPSEQEVADALGTFRPPLAGGAAPGGNPPGAGGAADPAGA